MAPPPYDNPSPFEVANWTDEESLRRYTQRRKDLEAMLRRFYWYVVGNSTAKSLLSDEDIAKVAQLVFKEGLEMAHLDDGSTTETSSPLFDILTSGEMELLWEGKDMILLFHAFAVQCEGDYAAAVSYENSLWGDGFRSQDALWTERDNEEFITFAVDGEPDTADCYWYAMDGPEMEKKLGELLPFAERLDNRLQGTDPELRIAPAISWALDNVRKGCSDIQIVDRIRKLSNSPSDSWLWYENGSRAMSKGQFVITFVGAQYCNLRNLHVPVSENQDESIDRLVREMERCLRLLEHYRKEPASEPHNPKEAGDREVEDLRKAKRQLIEDNEQLRKEIAELRRESKRLKTAQPVETGEA
ncbi:hypothetical protein B0T11DRAFT_329343 [Plectosphaerella cucumerina]|uniref:Uncharacterized protein n=1 Tax=Plectosphaerella cucumerina TaxID=40658 RepID=A0A8K0TKW1_9PEZI|nr:hypothetical protein B0T11DRAFT_329343 [Plectosphaerella cucumerina]